MTTKNTTETLHVGTVDAETAEALQADAIKRLEGEIKNLTGYKAAFDAGIDSLIVYAANGGAEPSKLLSVLIEPAGKSVYRQDNGYEPNLSGQKTDAYSWEVGDWNLTNKVLGPVNGAYARLGAAVKEASEPADVAVIGAAIWKFLQAFITLQSAWRRDYLQTRAYAGEDECCRICMRFKGETERGNCSPHNVLVCVKVLLGRALERIRKAQEPVPEPEPEPEPESELFCAVADFLAFIEKYVEAPANKQRDLLLDWWRKNGAQVAQIVQGKGEGAE
jgi:hypothetical protein